MTRVVPRIESDHPEELRAWLGAVQRLCDVCYGLLKDDDFMGESRAKLVDALSEHYVALCELTPSEPQPFPLQYAPGAEAAVRKATER